MRALLLHNNDRLTRIFSCMLLIRNHIIFLVQFEINCVNWFPFHLYLKRCLLLNYIIDEPAALISPFPKIFLRTDINECPPFLPAQTQSLATNCTASYSCTHSVYVIPQQCCRTNWSWRNKDLTQNITPAQIYWIFGCFIFFLNLMTEKLSVYQPKARSRPSQSLLSFIADINECSSNPCLNGGTCVDRVNGYVCNCQPGYNGVRCQTGEWLLPLPPLVNTCMDYIIR